MPLSDETGLLSEPDPREPYGRLFHEQGRLTVNAEREKPFAVGPWEDRTDEQREIDMRGASAVAAEALRQYEAEREELTLARLSRSARLARIAAYIRRRAEDDASLKVIEADILAIIGDEEAGDAG